MPEQPHPWDRTVDLPPQDPWAQPTSPQLAAPHAARPQPPAPPAPAPPFSRGVAHVKPALPKTESFTAEHHRTGTGWPGEQAPPARQPMGRQLQQLRRGGEWSFAAAVFAFVGWGIWAVSGDGDLLSPLVMFMLILAVAAGIFALARLLGRVVLERQLGRTRRTARGAHLVAALFLTGVGITYLQQTEWVVDAWNWVADLF
jgi:hypothetical protein